LEIAENLNLNCMSNDGAAMKVISSPNWAGTNISALTSLCRLLGGWESLHQN
jgi:hypothetical protein